MTKNESLVYQCLRSWKKCRQLCSSHYEHIRDRVVERSWSVLVSPFVGEIWDLPPGYGRSCRCFDCYHKSASVSGTKVEFPCGFHQSRKSGSFAVHDTGAPKRRAAFHWEGMTPQGVQGGLHTSTLDTRTKGTGWPRSGRRLEVAWPRSASVGKMAEIRSAT